MSDLSKAVNKITELSCDINRLQKRITVLEAQVSNSLEYARQTYTRARLMDQKTPMMKKLLSSIERLLETLESEGDAISAELAATDTWFDKEGDAYG